MDENDTKFLAVALAAIAVMVTLSLTTFNDSGTMPVLAQEQEERSNEDCAKLVDEVKGLDRENILQLADNGELQDLRLSLVNCSANSNLEESLKPDDLEKLDPTVIAILGPDIMQNLIR